MTAPNVIWLQWGDGAEEEYVYPSEGVTWCSDQINDTDVRYVRADAQPAAPTERWEPVEDGCHGNVRQRDGSLLLDMGIEDDERIILLPAGYALCRRPEVTE